MASLRRSSAKLRSLGSERPDLKLALSQLRELRSAQKALATAQENAANDLVKWSSKEENRAVKDVLQRFGDLVTLWTEGQREYAEHLKEFRHQFELILEGERNVDAAKANVEAAEAKETKLRKEHKKIAKKNNATAEEVQDAADKVTKAQREKDYADTEANCKVKEHEAVKMVRVKDALAKLCQAQLDLSEKTTIVFSAVRDVTDQIPDLTTDMSDDDLMNVKYVGAPITVQAVMRAKDQLKHFTPTSTSNGLNMSMNGHNSNSRGASPPTGVPPPPPIHRAASLPSSPPAYDEIHHAPQPPVNPYFSSNEASFNSSYGYNVSSANTSSANGSGLYPDLGVDEDTLTRRPRPVQRHSSYHEDAVNSQVMANLGQCVRELQLNSSLR